MSEDDKIKILRGLVRTGPHASIAEMEALPQGVALFLQALRDLLPWALDEIDRAVGQEKQTAATLDGFMGDLERMRDAKVPTEIHCPQCKMLHVDLNEWASTRLHRKHLCAGCGHVWAPYAVTTVGVDFHIDCRKKLAQISDAALEYGTPKSLTLPDGYTWELPDGLEGAVKERRALVDANEALTKRRDELLQQIWNLSQSTPLDSETANAIDAQRALIAEVGTLKARVAELEREKAERNKPREYVNMATEYDGTDYG